MREFANTSTSTSTFTLALTKAGPNLGGPEHRELEILTLLTQGISANFPLRHTGNATHTQGTPHRFLVRWDHLNDMVLESWVVGGDLSFNRDAVHPRAV
jgi:hypothetical protein